MGKRSKGIIISYIYTVLNLIAGIFLSAFTIRVIGDQNYGVYKTISSFVNYLVLLEFGVGTILTRNISICRSNGGSQEEINKHISTLGTVALLLSLIIVAFSAGFYFLIDPIYSKTLTISEIAYGQKMFLFLTLYLLCSFLSQTLNGIVIAYEYYSFSSLVSLIRLVLRVGLLVSFILLTKQSIVIAIIDSALSLIVLIITIIFCIRKCQMRFSFKKFDKSIFISALPLSLALLLQTVVNEANNNVDPFLIGALIGPKSVTVYSISLFVFSFFSSLTSVPITMYMPQVAKDLSKKPDMSSFTDTLIEPCRLVAILGGSIFFGFIAVGKQFIQVVYGAGYQDAWIIAIILMGPAFVYMTNGVLVNVLDVLNKRLFKSLVLIGITALNILLTIFFIQWWEIIGAAIATAIATTLGQILVMNFYYAKVLHIRILHLYFEAYRGILAFEILAGLASFLSAFFISSSIISLITGFSVYCLCFLPLYLSFGANSFEKRKFHSLTLRLKGNHDQNK